jgi:hypothetical protein
MAVLCVVAAGDLDLWSRGVVRVVAYKAVEHMRRSK